MKVFQFPLTKISLSFILGILSAYYSQTPITVVFPILVFLSLSLGLCCYLWVQKHKRLDYLICIQIYSFAFFLGVLTLLLRTESFQESNYTHHRKLFETNHPVTLTIREKLKSNSYNYRYIAHVNTIENKSHSGKIILNLKKESTASPLIIGNIIHLNITFQRNSVPKNPNQFNYANYLNDKHIYGQVYTESNEVLISRRIKKDIWYYTAKLHSRILYNLEKANFGKTEMNVALALILGQRQEISSEIVQDYQFSGATHILSVSGLHVGFIMLFITFILKPIPNTRRGTLLKLSAILSSLFIFAIISGLSPSVLRSVVMFSFLAIGNQLRRGGNTYHTLLVSILLILLFEPYFLFDIGFQLSYIALFFILWFAPLLQKIATPKNKIVTYIWEILTVSFAAQIGTLPLCLYYFHQFPGLFFVTNIIIIPFLTFIMIIGIIVMAIAIFHSPPSFLIQAFELSIYALNKAIHNVASFESFVIRDISFNLYYLFSFYLLIVFTIIWFKKPTHLKLVSVLISVLFVQFSIILTKKQTETSQQLVIYNVKKNTLISERNGRNIILFQTRTNIKEESKNNVLNSYLVGNFGTLSKEVKLKNTLFYKGKKIAIIDSSGVYQTKIQPDILLLTESPKINLERLLKDLHPDIIVADGSNSYSILKIWKQTCLKLKIPFHSTNEKGFFTLD